MVELFLKKRLDSGEPVLMDGAMGSEIEHRGLPTTLPLWSAEALLTHPEMVLRIHKEYIEAGAEIIITNTFRTTRRAFAQRGMAEEAAMATALACTLARDARASVQTNSRVLIAGSIAPLEDCYSPQLTPPQPEIEAEHAELVPQLKAGGVDFILLETMITARETLSGMQAALRSEMPFAVSFCCDENLSLLGGEPLEDVVHKVEPFSPLFIGVNCVSTDTATRTVKHLRTITSLPISVYAQGDGLADIARGWKMTEERHLHTYLQAASEWLASGAQLIGGCCGTTPDYIRALQQLRSGDMKPVSQSPLL
ncbi:MAG: homocysteine S-methyltransferase family protein [Ktedonobacteraceae bacterium]|nr:homocysteine S-methyltransferase family protein [Ktedonobacteraceae bacterium]